MPVGALLFPCGGDQVQVNEEKIYHSLSAHIVTSLALAIVLGAGAALAAYFLTQGVILWTGIAGGGGVAVVGILSYVILRCVLGRTQNPTSSTHVPIEPRAMAGGQPDPAPSLPPASPPPPQATAPVQVQPVAANAKEIAICLPQNGAQLLDQITNLEFSKRCREQGVVYIDQTNELPISLLQLYQNLIPLVIGAKAALIKELFVRELELLNDVNQAQNYVRYFNSAAIAEFAKLAKEPNLKKFLEEYPTSKDLNVKRGIVQLTELTMQLQFAEWTCRWYCGVARPDGSCLFHTLAQCLTQLTGKVVTEKVLRMQCIEYMKYAQTRYGANNTVVSAFNMNPPVTYQAALERGGFSAKECLGTDQTPLGGQSFTHGRMIAELYNIRLVLVEGLQDEVSQQVPDPIIVEPFFEQGQRISLRMVGKSEDYLGGGTILIGNMSNHFFPIWLKNY